MKEFIEARDRLKISMQKEVEVMREVLANMHQEELSLLMQDKGTWNQVMQDRALLIQRLSVLRTARMEASKFITPPTDKVSGQIDSLEKILPIEEENSSEILSLRDQLMALMERLNTQVCRNEELFRQIGNKLGAPIKIAEKIAVQPQKRKAAIATYPSKY